MKKIFLSISTILTGIILFSSCEDKQFKTDTYIDSFSYAQGLVGGTGYRTIIDSVKIKGELGDNELFYEAFRAGFYNDTSHFLMTREEAYDLIRKHDEEVKRKALEEREKRINEEAAFNKIKAEEFLKNYKEEKNVVILENGVMYKVLKTGYGPKPTLQDTVIINFEGKRKDGEIFVNTFEKGKRPVKIAVKDINELEGLKSAILEMPKYSTWEIVLPPDLAYGKNGSIDGKVPSNSVVILKVELQKVINP